jgi:large subunit ribosomal protein L25
MLEVPCVIRRRSTSTFFSKKSIQKLGLHSNAHTVVIDLGKENHSCNSKDIQVHPVSDKILHIDFFQLFDDKEITWKFQ